MDPTTSTVADCSRLSLLSESVKLSAANVNVTLPGRKAPVKPYRHTPPPWLVGTVARVTPAAAVPLSVNSAVASLMDVSVRVAPLVGLN